MKKQKIFIAFLAVLFFGLFLHSNVNASELEPSVLKDDISRIEMTGSESMKNKNSLKNSGEIEQEIDEILDHGKITEPISTDENPTETTNEEPPILEETETTNEEPPILEETESTNDEPPILEETETTNDEPSVLEESIPTKKEVVEKNQSLVEGVNIIDGIPYVYDVNGKLVRSKWYTTSTGRKTYADKNGITHINDVWALSDGNYVFGKEGYLIYNDWLKTDDGKQAFAAPKTGKAYSKGSFTVSDGIRYVFDANGYILKNNWQYEPGYGWSYGRPQDGAAYSQGAYTLNDGIRYAFDNYGYLAVNRWIYEPGYGYAFGKPSAGKNDRGGAVYKQGAFTVNDGVRYAFDNYGYLAVNRWIYEPGYGYAFGRPSMGKNDSGGAAYRQGAYTLNDGIRYAFDNYGYLAVNRWIYEPGYGYAFGRPSMGRNDRGGAVYRQGAFTVNDGTRYTFNEYGYKTYGWVYEKGYGWTFGDYNGKTLRNRIYKIEGTNYVFGSDGYLTTGFVKDQKSGRWVYGLPGKSTSTIHDLGKAATNQGVVVDGEMRAFDYQGYYTSRWWGGENGTLTMNGQSNFMYIDKSVQAIWVVRNGSVVGAAPVVTGDVLRRMQTPRGNFRVLAKSMWTVLSGPGYSSAVKYWMPFTNSGHGVHDSSSWRAQYGGNLYYNSGSHGCVNVPRSVVDVFWPYVYVGMPIYIK